MLKQDIHKIIHKKYKYKGSCIKMNKENLRGIVINKSHGAGWLSPEAYIAYAYKKNHADVTFYKMTGSFSEPSYQRVVGSNLAKEIGPYDEFVALVENHGDNITQDDVSQAEHIEAGNREDPILIDVVESLGNQSGQVFGSMKVVYIPRDVDYEVAEYDGAEYIQEKHRTWE